MIALGLRFDRSESRKLRVLAARVRNGELPGAVNTFEQAATAAESGEPLVVWCAEPVEAVQMAVGYIVHGIKRPTIEDLSGTARPA